MVKRTSQLENASTKFTRWVGSTNSLALHTVLFAGSFMLVFFGYPLDSILLIVTTVVSLEAIYLAIFIQMTVNKSMETIEEVGEGVEEIQEDVQEIQEDVGEIQGDVKELEGDIEDISQDIDKIQEEDQGEAAESVKLEEIHAGLKKLLSDIESLKREHDKPNNS